jgi:phage terminase large subunit GpA-like protein
MLRRGKWKAVEKKTENVRSVGFWMNTLYSPFVKFSDVAFEFMTSKDDPDKLQNFVNSWLAEPWEDTQIKTSADMVLERQTELPRFTLPEWTEILTGGVDVQQNCLYWTIRAWGKFMTSQNIAHGQAVSFDEITRMMNLEYQTESGKRMTVQLCLVDSGFATDDVYDYCLRNLDWTLPCRGNAKASLNGLNYKISKVEKNIDAYGMRLIIIDTGRYKDLIASRMRRRTGIQGAWMVYKGCDREYAEQVTAEHRVKVKGKPLPQWETKTSHADNHYLDCEVYCTCAADMLGARALYLKDEQAEEEEKKRQQRMSQQTQREQSMNLWLPNNTNWI